MDVQWTCMPSMDHRTRSIIELDVGAVHGVGLPVGGDDLVGDERPAGAVGDAQREGPPQRAARVQAPDGAPRVPHRPPGPRRLAAVHEVHLRHVAVAVRVLHQDRQVVRVRPLLHMERHRQPRVLARHPLELHVDDAGVAELVVAAVLGHGAKSSAAEVEVVASDGVVVHVRDDHRLGDAGARRVSLASDLVAGAASLAVLEERLVAARRHGVERRQVHVLESTRATIVVRPGAIGCAIPGGPRV
uniref:Uncharacterized protein n=1 Tax=Triticum urartu TaxID=4572 RepID=A0A8R7PYI8_TRIUA